MVETPVIGIKMSLRSPYTMLISVSRKCPKAISRLANITSSWSLAPKERRPDDVDFKAETFVLYSASLVVALVPPGSPAELESAEWCRTFIKANCIFRRPLQVCKNPVASPKKTFLEDTGMTSSETPAEIACPVRKLYNNSFRNC
jgi:hypothetical protein